MFYVTHPGNLPCALEEELSCSCWDFCYRELLLLIRNSKLEQLVEFWISIIMSFCEICNSITVYTKPHTDTYDSMYWYLYRCIGTAGIFDRLELITSQCRIKW